MSRLYVLDTSVVAGWLLPDEKNQTATQMIRQTYNQTVYVPLHWQIEFLSVLRISEKKQRITAELSSSLLQDFKSLMTQACHPLGGNDETVLALSRQYDLTVYDAAYLEMGLRFGCPILTLDKALKDAAEKAGLPAWNGQSSQ